MYKRKFTKSRIISNENENENENDSSQYPKSTNSSNKASLSFVTPSMSVTSNISNDEESPESPSMLEDFNELPSEKKRKTVIDNNEDNTTNESEPLFHENDDPYVYLKQTLFSCGLHLNSDQNILSKSFLYLYTLDIIQKNVFMC